MLTSAAVIWRTYDRDVENSEALDLVEPRGNSLLTECVKWFRMSTNCAALLILVHIWQTYNIQSLVSHKHNHYTSSCYSSDWYSGATQCSVLYMNGAELGSWLDTGSQCSHLRMGVTWLYQPVRVISLGIINASDDLNYEQFRQKLKVHLFDEQKHDTFDFSYVAPQKKSYLLTHSLTWCSLLTSNHVTNKHHMNWETVF